MSEAPSKPPVVPPAMLPSSANPVICEQNHGTQRPTELSAAKIAANRKNALRSTGPRTPRGKAIARENALQHGFFAREVLIKAGVGQESEEEFESLLHDLIAELQPEGRIGDILMDLMAGSLWRLRRLYKFETAEIRKQVDHTENPLFPALEPFEDKLEPEVRLGTLLVPADPAVAKITRYENHLLRQFYRALNELRNQRRRRDEHARLRSQPI